MNNPLIVLCSGLSTLLPFITIAFVLKYTNSRPKIFLFLWIFFAAAAVSEIALFVLGSQSTPSAWIAHIYTLIEYVLISIVLASWQIKPAFAKLMRLSIPVYVLFFVLIKTAGLENFSTDMVNYVTRPPAVLLLSTFVFLTLQALWSHTPANLTDDYRFWMLLAMALYYSASLVLFAFMFTKNLDLLAVLLKLHAVVNIMHNFMFTIGVFRMRDAKTTALRPASAS